MQELPNINNGQYTGWFKLHENIVFKCTITLKYKWYVYINNTDTLTMVNNELKQLVAFRTTSQNVKDAKYMLNII